MATRTCINRLRQDYIRLKKDPVPYVTATPVEANILEWHYVVKGPEGTPYEGGYYWGKLVFPREYPFKPPRIEMTTPSGRFQTNTRLCLSISDFHPDTWNPAWSVSTILTGLLSFMVETAPTVGSLDSSDQQKKQLAKESWNFNLNNNLFRKLFPDVVEEIANRKREQARNQDRGDTNGRDPMSTQLPPQGALNGAISNIVVLLGFAMFAYTVAYLLRHLD